MNNTINERQVARLNREVEALEEQRARARDDAQRADEARIQLQAEVKVRPAWRAKGPPGPVAASEQARCAGWASAAHWVAAGAAPRGSSTASAIRSISWNWSCPAAPQELRKSGDQRVRDVQMTQGEATRALQEERAAFEKAQEELRVSEGREAGSQRSDCNGCVGSAAI
jgi:hypothetical protein